jgi:hypothetical protein
MFHNRKWMDTVDRWMMAITFAQAGQREMALSALNEGRKKKRVGSRVRKHAGQRPVLRA